MFSRGGTRGDTWRWDYIKEETVGGTILSLMVNGTSPPWEIFLKPVPRQSMTRRGWQPKKGGMNHLAKKEGVKVKNDFGG